MSHIVSFSSLRSLLLRASLPIVLSAYSAFALAGADQTQCPAWLNHQIGQLHSDARIDLCAATSGKAVLFVNTASYCGYTKQFGGLEKLHQQYKDKGLVIIGFPSDSFNQEADEEAKTAGICYENFGVSFLMTQHVPVVGPEAHPVFAYLSAQTKAPSWNFNKYLVSVSRDTVDRFSSGVSPESEKLNKAIRSALATQDESTHQSRSD